MNQVDISAARHGDRRSLQGLTQQCASAQQVQRTGPELLQNFLGSVERARRSSL